MEFVPVTEKRCPKCGGTKPLEAFGRDTHRKSGRAVYCLCCDAARRKEYYAANRAKVLQQEKFIHAHDAAARERRLHKDRRYSSVSQHKRRDRYAEDSTTVRARVMARHAGKLQATPGWADQDAITLIYAKAKEWSAILGIEMEVDHSTPLQSPLVCGLHTQDNLQLLYTGINQSKGNRYWPDMPGEG